MELIDAIAEVRQNSGQFVGIQFTRHPRIMFNDAQGHIRSVSLMDETPAKIKIKMHSAYTNSSGVVVKR